MRQAGLPAAEVHVLSDLQATALTGSAAAATDVPILVLRPGLEAALNRYLGSVLVGGGLPPLAGRRTELAVGVAGDTAEVGVRLVVGERIRAATRAPAGSSTVLPFGPFAAGWVDRFVETDPDELAGDDRRWFALPVLLPPSRCADRRPSSWQALAVLERPGAARGGRRRRRRRHGGRGRRPGPRGTRRRGDPAGGRGSVARAEPALAEAGIPGATSRSTRPARPGSASTGSRFLSSRCGSRADTGWRARLPAKAWR